ncbi:2-oxoacid:acceptor oxidoreductase subunit alpha [Wenzhouxiangella sp. AB-CW3]|uniref:2-oxoacid:acceptor oxidoreductase subunit alpha n=1 Tax=Wenzhouxiangella sp. AB-CW3 TaxID=2771012 RepID=UPI00168B2401|nr:2-oxoacid:acceptor oxidoreductase subunit alpha [Wenzhouxiangella sp. AB-CW3]QOC22479.1 2-oxoacid:acceptor oxidoreductase subunit alpha [Wenzhouxiangella sp. AB-CW3]
MSSDSLSLALIGSGGAGVMTAGQTLLDAAAACGLYGLMTRATGPQIRGGEAAAILRLSSEPVECQDDRLDVLLAIDWNKAERFADELILDANSRIIADPGQGQAPEWVRTSGARVLDVPLSELVKNHRGTRANTIAVGLLSHWIGLDNARTENTVRGILESKGARLVDAAIAGLQLGFSQARELPELPQTLPAAGAARERWLISGNEAVGLGALRAGVRFCAAYPITPSTEIQEWLAVHLPAVGGTLVQAEDELASINMCLGASFGGVPAITATSGPGFSLMVEALGLASQAEIPMVVVDVMRGGPSTGIPTRSEQADLNIAIHGAHGDAPRLVLAPNSIGDCVSTTEWAVHLAEALQTPAVVLSDQRLGQGRAAIPSPPPARWQAQRKLTTDTGESFRRFADSSDGISPMSLPGMAGGEYTATGLSHMASGRPSASGSDHRRQLDKRRRKLQAFDFGKQWADIEGDGDTAVLTWGSTTLAAREAVTRLRAKGQSVRLVSIRLLSPLDTGALEEALAPVKRLLIVEQSHGGQFHRYLRSLIDLPAHTRVLARPGPLNIGPGEIARAIQSLCLEEAA